MSYILSIVELKQLTSPTNVWIPQEIEASPQPHCPPTARVLTTKHQRKNQRDCDSYAVRRGKQQIGASKAGIA